MASVRTVTPRSVRSWAGAGESPFIPQLCARAVLTVVRESSAGLSASARASCVVCEAGALRPHARCDTMPPTGHYVHIYEYGADMLDGSEALLTLKGIGRKAARLRYSYS